jgi:hypothetical protein
MNVHADYQTSGTSYIKITDECREREEKKGQ